MTLIPDESGIKRTDDLNAASSSGDFKRYRTIVADPPWPLPWSSNSNRVGGGWGMVKHRQVGRKTIGYPTMTVDAITALPIGDLATAHAHLFLWVPDRWLISGEANAVLDAWGFTSLRLLIWAKAGFGLGRFPRPSHESIVVARRGTLAFVGPRDVGSVQFWKQPYTTSGGSVARDHSRKPEGFLDLVEQVSPGPYLELFARRQRLGWDTWGDEALNHVEISA